MPRLWKSLSKIIFASLKVLFHSSTSPTYLCVWLRVCMCMFLFLFCVYITPRSLLVVAYVAINTIYNNMYSFVFFTYLDSIQKDTGTQISNMHPVLVMLLINIITLTMYLHSLSLSLLSVLRYHTDIYKWSHIARVRAGVFIIRLHICMYKLQTLYTSRDYAAR